MEERELAKKGPGQDPSKGRGRGGGLNRMGICQHTETGFKYKVLPVKPAMKMIDSGKAKAAPNGAADCEALNGALISDEEYEEMTEE